MSHSRYALERCGCRHIPADPGHGPRPFRLPGDSERFGRARPFDLHHLRLELRLDIVARKITATATFDVTQRDPDARTLVLDAAGFEIAEVTRGDAAVPYRYDGDRLHIALGPLPAGERASISVRYSVEPRRGLYFLAPDDKTPERPFQVWSQCQDEDARYWIPCHDFPNMKMSTEFIVTAPEGWTVLSNGRLVSREKVEGRHGADTAKIGATGDGQERWHWLQEQPHVAYLMSLVAGNFSELPADLESLPVRYYVDPGREADGMRAFGRTPEMVEHFAQLTGVPYPWAKYYQVAVHDFIFGGMENTSATTMTDRILLDERAAIDNTADDIVAHELAHQWFGDLVTCRDWSHAWLNEGFATYFEHLDWEHKAGVDEYLYSLKEHAEGYFSEDEGRYRRPIVCNTYAYPIDLFDRHLYEKGGWVLHMLRAELGDRLFFGGVKRYLERHRGGIVETRDLLRAMEDESGRSLEAFFDQWVYRAGYPEIELEATHDADRGALTVTVRQKQAVDDVTPLFKLRMALDVVTEQGRERHVLDVSEAAQSFTLRAPLPPRRVAFDPDGRVLMKLTQTMPRDWLLDALVEDSHAVVRWRAAEALSKRAEPKVIDTLVHAVRKDAFWGVGAEAAHALGEIRSDRAYEALASLVDVGHPKVRRAVVRALGEFRTEKSARLLVGLLEKGDPSVLVEGEAARSAGRTKQSLVYDALVAALDRPSWRDTVRVGAMDGLAKLRDERALPLIDRFADKGAMLSTRRAAVAALGEFGEGKRAVRERLEQLLDGNDPYFTPEVLRALVKVKDPAALGAIAPMADRSLDGRVRRHAREAMRELRQKEHPDEVRRLADAFDRLRDEHQGLRDELARLKALALPEPDREPTAAATRTKARPARKRAATPGAKPRAKAGAKARGGRKATARTGAPGRRRS
jgi:aminopeptidase N